MKKAKKGRDLKTGDRLVQNGQVVSKVKHYTGAYGPEVSVEWADGSGGMAMRADDELDVEVDD